MGILTLELKKLYSEWLGADKSICNNDGIYAMDFAINAGKYCKLLCGICRGQFPVCAHSFNTECA